MTGPAQPAAAATAATSTPAAATPAAATPAAATPAAATPAAAPPAAARPPRRRGVAGSVLDMVRSLGLLFVAIALIWFVSGMWHNSTRTQTAITDWRSEVTALAPGAPFAVVAPSSLPAGWSVTVVRLSGTGAAADWTMTVTTATGGYLDLDQAAGPVAALVATDLPDAVAAGTVQVGSNSWSRFTLDSDAQGARRGALARSLPSTAVLVSGTGSAADQQAFAGSLTPAR